MAVPRSKSMATSVNHESVRSAAIVPVGITRRVSQGAPAQPLHAVTINVGGSHQLRSIRRMQQIPLLGTENKKPSVNQPEQLLKVGVPTKRSVL